MRSGKRRAEGVHTEVNKSDGKTDETEWQKDNKSGLLLPD